MKEYVVNARMPYYSEISNVSKTSLSLIDYLDGSLDTDADVEITGRNGVNGVYGYWTLSSNNNPAAFFAWYVNRLGNTLSESVLGSGYIGVRPVINLNI